MMNKHDFTKIINDGLDLDLDLSLPLENFHYHLKIKKIL